VIADKDANASAVSDDHMNCSTSAVIDDNSCCQRMIGTNDESTFDSCEWFEKVPRERSDYSKLIFTVCMGSM